MQTEHDFNQFYEAHHRRVHYQIHRLGISADWHEQFFQEGIIALWNAYHQYDKTKGEFGTYLNYTIRYRLLDLLRKKMRTQNKDEKLVEEGKTDLDDGNRHRATEKPLVANKGIELEDTTFWDTVKDELNDNQWKWVQYFLIAELSIKEIMEIENVTQDTVKSWGRAARKKLRAPEIKDKLITMLDE